MQRRYIKYVGLEGGYCALSTASKKAILDAHGRDNVTVIRPATKDEVEWVRAMGGHVPEDVRRAGRLSRAAGASPSTPCPSQG